MLRSIKEIRTFGTIAANPPMTGLKGVDSTVSSGNTKASANVAPKPNSRTIHGQECGFTTGAASTSELVIVWVSCTTPQRIRALESKHRLRYIRLHDRDTTSGKNLCYKLR